MYKDLDEQALAGFCSRRDRLAADELYRRYAARVYALCKRYLGDGNESVIPMMKNAGSFHFQENEHFCAILFAGKYAGDGAD